MRRSRIGCVGFRCGCPCFADVTSNDRSRHAARLQILTRMRHGASPCDMASVPIDGRRLSRIFDRRIWSAQNQGQGVRHRKSAFGAEEVTLWRAVSFVC